jgi:hypothetical protein
MPGEVDYAAQLAEFGSEVYKKNSFSGQLGRGERHTSIGAC